MSSAGLALWAQIASDGPYIWRDSVGSGAPIGHVSGGIANLRDERPHGNFDCFQSLLRAAGVIDSTYHWTLADGHLVVIGDVMDRGVDVMPIFWLLYELEGEAQQAGGTVSFLLGNHETLVLKTNKNYKNFLFFSKNL